MNLCEEGGLVTVLHNMSFLLSLHYFYCSLLFPNIHFKKYILMPSFQIFCLVNDFLDYAAVRYSLSEKK